MYCTCYDGCAVRLRKNKVRNEHICLRICVTSIKEKMCITWFGDINVNA